MAKAHQPRTRTLPWQKFHTVVRVLDRYPGLPLLLAVDSRHFRKSPVGGPADFFHGPLCIRNDQAVKLSIPLQAAAPVDADDILVPVKKRVEFRHLMAVKTDGPMACHHTPVEASAPVSKVIELQNRSGLLPIHLLPPLRKAAVNKDKIARFHDGRQL